MLFGDYVWDDRILFVDSPDLRQTENVISSVFKPVFEGTSYFRPVVMLSFMVQFSVLGVSALISHSVNLLLHLLNILLLWLLIRQLSSSESAGKTFSLREVLVVLFFAVHPAVVGPVAWISGRFDLAVTSFVLAGLLTTAHNSKKTKPSGFLSLLVALCFLLAAGCKEMAVVFPVAWFAVVWSVKREDLQSFLQVMGHIISSRLFELISVLLAGFGYLILRFYFLDGISTHYDVPLADLFPGLERVKLVCSTLVFYLKMIFVPFVDLGPMHPLTENTGNANVYSGGLVIVAALVGAGFLVKKFNGGLLFFLVGVFSLLPVLNILPLTILGNIGHERFLVLPLVFITLALSFLSKDIGIKVNEIAKVRGSDRLAIVLKTTSVIWVLVAAISVHSVLPLWKNNLALWSWCYEKYSGNPYIQANLISAATDAGQFDVVETVIDDLNEKQVEIYYKVKASLAIYYSRINDFDKSIELLDEIIESNESVKVAIWRAASGDVVSVPAATKRLQLGIVAAYSESYFGKREFDKSIVYADLGFKYRTDYSPLYFMKGMALLALGKFEEGLSLISTAHSLVIEDSESILTSMLLQFIEQECSLSELEIVANSRMCTKSADFVNGISL